MATWAREACHPLFPKAASTATAIEALTPRDMFLGSLKNIPQTGTSIIETQTRQLEDLGRSPFVPKKHTKKNTPKNPWQWNGTSNKQHQGLQGLYPAIQCDFSVRSPSGDQTSPPNLAWSPVRSSSGMYAATFFAQSFLRFGRKVAGHSTFRKNWCFYKYFSWCLQIVRILVGTYCVILHIYTYMMHHQNILYNIIYSRSKHLHFAKKYQNRPSLLRYPGCVPLLRLDLSPLLNELKHALLPISRFKSFLYSWCFTIYFEASKISSPSYFRKLSWVLLARFLCFSRTLGKGKRLDLILFWNISQIVAATSGKEYIGVHPRG